MPGRLTPPDHTDRPRAAHYLRVGGEVVLSALVVLSPWPFASNDPLFEFALTIGLVLLGGLWAAHASVTRQFAFRPDVVSAALSGLALLSAIQLVPLPESIVAVVSPARAAWHRELQPDRLEVVPGEPTASPRPASLTLTADPSATRTFLARVLGVLLAYAAARNWLASRTSFRRLAWVLAGNGAALAVFALVHLFSAPRGVLFWSVPVEGDGGFGPFVCRNHFPDYVALCAGLGIGLLFGRTGSKSHAPADLLTARNLGLIAMTGVVLVSIPFSLSRGGVLSVIVAGAAAWLLTRTGKRDRAGGAGKLALAAAVGVGALIAVWLGAELVEERFATLGSGAALDSRLPLWRDAARLVPDFWPTGTGAGTFVWVEPTVRTGGQASFYYENAHNEYLEALVEGGVLRLGLTLLLAGGTLVVVGRGYWRRRDRSVGPLLLGAWFGLAAVAVHAAGDFGVHMPAIAVAVAVVAGFAVAAATDEQFVPPKGRAGRSGAADPASVDEPGWTARGPAAIACGLVPVLAALLVALDAHTRDRAARLQIAGELAYRDADDPDRLAKRAMFYDARAAVRPDDPDALFEAAQAHLDAAIADTWAPGAGLAGGGAGFVAVPERFPQPVLDRHVYPALRLLRAARSANPLAPKPHSRLALYAEYFASAEPAAVHFARAKRLLPTDPDLWYAAGREAFRRGDEPAAWADWKRSVGLSPRHLKPIVMAAHGKLSPADLRARVLPDEPVALMAAADVLFPDRGSADRRGFADAAIASAGRPGLSADQHAAVAAAFDELDRSGDAAAAWRAAVDTAPQRPDLRDRFARWLEQEERYDEAVPHLEWLARQYPSHQAIRDRLDAVRHGQRLRQIIEGK